MPVFLLRDNYAGYNAKKGVYEPDPSQNAELHYLGEPHHWKEVRGILVTEPGT